MPNLKRLVGILILTFVAALWVDAASPVLAQQPNPKKLNKIRYWANQLSSELTHLLEDVAIDLPKQQQHLIYDHVDQVLRQVNHFNRTLDSNAGMDHIFKDFVTMDKHVHGLMKTIESVGLKSPTLRNGLNRVHYADQQLHFLLTQGNAGNWREAVARQAHLLEDEGEHLLKAVNMYSPTDPAGQKLRQSVVFFVKEARHFHKSVEKGADAQHLKNDFQNVDQSWHQVVNNLNNSWQGKQYYIRNIAQRVSDVHNNLYEMVGGKGKPPHIHFSWQTTQP